MKLKLSRRDFLKLASTLSLAPLLRYLPAEQPRLFSQGSKPPNIIFILFDALTAADLSLYGYPRHTSPNFERFASRATVYHNHHSAGNFTTPSTASLFTSSYPWTHRAFDLGALITPKVVPFNLFKQLKGVYYQAAFAQNIFADMLLYQFNEFLGRHEKLDSFTLAGHTFYNHLFNKDANNGLYSVDQFLFKREEEHGSLFLSIANDFSTLLSKEIFEKKLEADYPAGLPRMTSTDVYFLMNQVMSGVMGLFDQLPSPFFSYLHFIPPHEPYQPSGQQLGLFVDDGWTPPAKKKHPLSPNVSDERLNERRVQYDEYIANLDAEFGRLIDHLDKTGLLANSYVILTADHGELFERGTHGHSTPLVFEPVIHIPLVISSPGQSQRKDIHALTSNVDLAPTILNIAGLPIPDWCQGQALPDLGGKETPDRTIYVVEAKQNSARSPLRKATVAMIQGQYKLVHYFGYTHYSDKYEFYDLQNDPEELKNQYSSNPLAREMQALLDQKIVEVNEPYLANKN